MRSGILLTCLLLVAPGCIVPKATAPMPIDTHRPRGQSHHLAILFPGYGDRLGTFRQHDFFSLVDQHPGAFANALMVETDAHIGYYRTRSLPERVERDILQRFPDQQNLTLIGASMGGMGASIVASFNPDRVERLILFAPYLGGRRVLKRVKADDLQPRKGDSLRVQGLLKAWRFLVEDAAQTGAEITVLYGTSDRLAGAIELLAAKAPHVKVITREGGHGWATWTPLWQTYLQQQSQTKH